MPEAPEQTSQDAPGSTQRTPPATQVPPKIGPWFPAGWNRRPPGMTWDDWQPWQPWMAARGREWPEWAYNVRLYLGDPDPPITDPSLDRQWRELNAKRIDALGRRENVYTIFEARRNAGWSSVGQLLGYKTLWTINYPDLALDALYLITETVDPGIRATAHLHDLIVWTPADK